MVNQASTTSHLTSSAVDRGLRPGGDLHRGREPRGAGPRHAHRDRDVHGRSDRPGDRGPEGGYRDAHHIRLTVASHTITASYGGDGNFLGKARPDLTQTVKKAGTTAGVTSSVNPSVFGQSVTFTVTVTANAPGSGTPTGTVQFKVDGAN